MSGSVRASQKRRRKSLYNTEEAQARRNANRNLRLMEKKPKKPNKSFIANYDSGECPRCFLLMEKGQRLMYNVDGVLSHARHDHPEPKFEICDRCWLTKPCECE